MRCQNCGTHHTEASNYCKQCGSNMTTAVNFAPPPVAAPRRGQAGLFWLIALSFVLSAGVGIGGFVLVMILTIELARMGVPVWTFSVLGIASLFMLLGTVALIGRQVSRLVTTYQQTFTAAQASNAVLDTIRPPSSINSFREPVVSVTEHTTRTLAPVSFRE